MPVLVRPSLKYAESYAEAIREFRLENSEYRFSPDNIEAHIKDELNKAYTQQSDRVPSTVYWLIDGQRFLARGSIRHKLNDYLAEFGGHIGYEVRPSERRKGYGTLLLSLMLPEAKKLGLDRVLICCDTDNRGSIRIIEKNGGVKRDTHMVSWYPSPFYRWWIYLADVPE